LLQGREVLRRTEEYLDSGRDFAIETTLSGNWTTAAIKDALSRGFFVRLVFICVDNPEQSIQRVHERVAQGGHHVPDEDVRRRYSRSVLNLKRVAGIVNETIIYDNSGPEPRLILEIRSGNLVGTGGDLPVWARDLPEHLGG
jgi:predicted ABC-type ATPase